MWNLNGQWHFRFSRTGTFLGAHDGDEPTLENPRIDLDIDPPTMRLSDEFGLSVAAPVPQLTCSQIPTTKQQAAEKIEKQEAETKRQRPDPGDIDQRPILHRNPAPSQATPQAERADRIDGGSQPVLLSRVDPEYSEEAKQAKFEGTVFLQLVVGLDGHARDVRVVKGVGLGLDEKAIECVRRWTFKPVIKDGRPVQVGATVNVDFRLR
jgi:TonB family protein